MANDEKAPRYEEGHREQKPDIKWRIEKYLKKCTTAAGRKKKKEEKLKSWVNKRKKGKPTKKKVCKVYERREEGSQKESKKVSHPLAHPFGELPS